MNRRGFLAVLGLAGGVRINVEPREPRPVDAMTPGAASGDETLTISVYDPDDHLLAERDLCVAGRSMPDASYQWRPLDEVKIVLDGPITVQRITVSVPSQLANIRKQPIDLRVYPATAREKGETITVLLPDPLISVG